MSSSDQSPPRAKVPGLTRDGSPSTDLVPPPPLMRVVTKGWWVWREERASVEDLAREDREIEERTAKRRKR